MFTRTVTNIVLASLLIAPVLPYNPVPEVYNHPAVSLPLMRAPIRPPGGEASVKAMGAVADTIAAATPAAITLEGAGGDEILGGYVDAFVQDAEGYPVADQVVGFVAARGTIESPVETDAAGHAYAGYLGPCGTDVITVTAGVVSATIELQSGNWSGAPTAFLRLGIARSTVCRWTQHNNDPCQPRWVYGDAAGRLSC